MAPLSLRLLLCLCALGCGDKEADTAPAGATVGGGVGGEGTADGGDGDGDAGLAWYATCGDPACGGYRGPTAGLAVCTDQAEGAACSEDGAACDLEDDCNTQMLCTATDPKASEYGCPQSRAAVKTDIAYLGPAERAQARAALLQTRLATWRYRWEPPTHKPHLGFLIDDQPASPAVAADGAHVDLYGYTSLAVAALQAQDALLQQQQSELRDTRAALSETRAALSETQAALAQTQAALAALRAEVAALAPPVP